VIEGFFAKGFGTPAGLKKARTDLQMAKQAVGTGDQEKAQALPTGAGSYFNFLAAGVLKERLDVGEYPSAGSR